MDILTTPPVEVASDSASASGLSYSGNAPSSAAPGKMRAACNRCHAQKLRCRKKVGEVKCDRCRKLHTSCQFSPRAPRSSPKNGERVVNGMEETFPLFVPTDMPTMPSNIVTGDGGSCSSDWAFSQNPAIGVANGPGIP